MNEKRDLKHYRDPLAVSCPRQADHEKCWMCGAPVLPGEELLRGEICRNCQTDTYGRD